MSTFGICNKNKNVMSSRKCVHLHHLVKGQGKDQLNLNDLPILSLFSSYTLLSIFLRKVLCMDIIINTRL